MKPRVKLQDSGMEDLFRSKLKSIINLRHGLVRLGELLDWARLEAHFAPYYKEEGRPGLPIRLVVGLHLLKHIEGLSDEAVCARWERDPYMQYFCGEEYFQHAFPLERAGMTHFRNRVGEQALEALLQETLAAAAADPRRAAQDGTGSCFIGAHGNTAGQRAGPCWAHRTSTARRQRLSLFLARAGSGMHQQRQSARPVRIRLQSFYRHESASGQGR